MEEIPITTIRKEISMEIRTIVAPDLFSENEVLRFQSQRLQSESRKPEIGAASIVVEEKKLPRDLKTLDKVCAENAIPLIFENTFLTEYKFWLFLAHEPWQPKSAMVRHKKLWKSLPTSWNLDCLQLFPEIMIESSEGLRYFGIAEVKKETFYNATQILRNTRAGAIVLSKRNYGKSESEVIQLFDYAFPKKNELPQNAIDWQNLSIGCCPAHDIIVRVSGSWDEREVSLDLIMLRELLPFFS